MNTAIMAVGRRKTSNARVMLKPGTGKCTVNNKDITAYFPRGTHRLHILEGMKVVEIGSQYDVHANVAGGGLSGQAGAIRLGIARALVKIDEELKPKLKPLGLMSRDPRMKERRKYGLAKARKRFQFSKR